MDGNIEIDLKDIASSLNLGNLAGNNGVPNLTNKGEQIMNNPEHAMNSALESLASITGFMAAGVYNSSGDVLSRIDRESYSFEEIGCLAIELYSSAKSISDKMGLGICNFVEVHTEKYIFVHMCIVPGKGAMGVLLNIGGNVGLVRHQMKKEGLRLIPEFE